MSILKERPYISSTFQKQLIEGTRAFVTLEATDLGGPAVFHVDFTDDEARQLLFLLTQAMGLPAPTTDKDICEQLRHLYTHKSQLCKEAVAKIQIRGRTPAHLEVFLKDLAKRKVHPCPQVLSLARDDFDKQGAMLRSNRASSLLLAREMAGQRGYGSMRRPQNFMNEFKKSFEDGLELRTEWTNCAGDINTITWVSNDGFICGTTEHSDTHNQQYNKPGNLVLGSCSAGTLKAYPDHRIIRPRVEKGENSTDEMRESQDPWLYTTVVASDYDRTHDRTYTCSFDRTVKIWRADKSGASMSLLGTWLHDGNVNFVVASSHASGMVATAADVHTNAVRVYLIEDENENNVSGSRYWSYSCSRVVDEQGRAVSTEKWAYYPATIQWGRCPEVDRLLLVGYSPRSRTGDDNDIPEDRQGAGEICVWDGTTGEQWKLLAGSGLNVFEVAWHPTQPCFIAATSPQGVVGSELDTRIRTQIRVFRKSLTEHNAFGVIQTLDCTAVDINELAIRPNSFSSSYIAAGCTDGRCYVWDTALGDKPIHVLKHGEPMEDFRAVDHTVDTGVKFCAWGNTPDRFYTGSSDGVVKVWNVRSENKKPLVRDLLEVKGPVSFGKFSPDRSKLIIGDASGRVFFLSVDEEDQKPETLAVVGANQLGTKRRVPRLVIPHPEPAPPAEYHQHQTGRGLARAYLEKGQLVLNKDPTIGAVQGPRYPEMGRYDRFAHMDEDVTRPLNADIDPMQLEARKMYKPVLKQAKRRLRPIVPETEAERRHRINVAKDLDFASLPLETKLDLAKAGVDVRDLDADYDLDEAADLGQDEWMATPLSRECDGCTAEGCAPTS